MICNGKESKYPKYEIEYIEKKEGTRNAETS